MRNAKTKTVHTVQELAKTSNRRDTVASTHDEKTEGIIELNFVVTIGCGDPERRCKYCTVPGVEQACDPCQSPILFGKSFSEHLTKRAENTVPESVPSSQLPLSADQKAKSSDKEEVCHVDITDSYAPPFHETERKSC